MVSIHCLFKQLQEGYCSRMMFRNYNSCSKKGFYISDSKIQSEMCHSIATIKCRKKIKLQKKHVYVLETKVFEPLKHGYVRKSSGLTVK